MLSMNGLRKAVKREMYRQERYGGSFTLVAISIRTGGARCSGQEELLRSSAKTISRTLRETDISAYVGDGVFAILLVELKKMDAEEILVRLAEKIRVGAGPQLGIRAEIDYEFETWSESDPADMDTINDMLKKFRKKM